MLSIDCFVTYISPRTLIRINVYIEKPKMCFPRVTVLQRCIYLPLHRYEEFQIVHKFYNRIDAVHRRSRM